MNYTSFTGDNYGFSTKILLPTHLSILFLSLFIFSITNNLHAQTPNVKTEVNITSGLSDEENEQLEQNVESILTSINEFTIDEVDSFENTPGMQQLKEIIKPKKMVSNLNVVNTFIITTKEGNYAIPKIYLRPIDGNEFSYEEFELLFSPELELIGSAIRAKQKNFERILRRSSEADANEKEKVSNFVESYTQAFANKDITSVRNLFDPNSSIVTGSIKEDEGFVEYNRYSYEDYMNRLEERVLTSYNEVNITFKDSKIYRHPDFLTSYGFYAKQNYFTSSYADTGYTFMIIDFASDQPRVVSRTWQPNQFKLSSYSKVAPKPRKLQARLTDVRTRVDNSNLSLTKSMPRDQGLLQIELETNDLSLINADIAREWINQQTMTFSNLELLDDFIEIIDKKNIRIPFKSTWEPGKQRTRTELSIRGTSVIDDFKSSQILYLQRLNIMTIKILSREEEKLLAEQNDTTNAEESEYDFAEEFAFEGKIKFSLNVKNTNVKIFTESDQLLLEEMQPDSDMEFQLLEGDYRFEFTKEGYRSRVVNIPLNRTEIIRHHIVVPPKS